MALLDSPVPPKAGWHPSAQLQVSSSTLMVISEVIRLSSPPPSHRGSEVGGMDKLGSTGPRVDVQKTSPHGLTDRYRQTSSLPAFYLIYLFRERVSL